ncbi:MAG: ribbon-helix-helix domain-containing protein [Candidatus Hodarchaeales archaeon]|jgi:Arc/MetJ-type ribon-helix-helix transcriptional regulator
MIQVVCLRMTKNMVRLLDNLVDQGLYRSRSRVIELLVMEGLEKRNLIDYKEFRDKS